MTNRRIKARTTASGVAGLVVTFAVLRDWGALPQFDPWTVGAVGLAILGVRLAYFVTEPAAHALGEAFKRLIDRLWQ